MEDRGSRTACDGTTLTSPSALSYNFTVAVRGAGESEEPALTFEVTGVDLSSGAVTTAEYRLPRRDHDSYLDLFEALARDFGTRLPLNRRPTSQPSFKAAFRPLLTENIAPGILYGYGDPAVLRLDEGCGSGAGAVYYLVVTSNDAPDSFPLLRSADLRSWEFAGFIFPKGRKPKWAADGFLVSDYWAPELHKVQGEFRLYFAAREKHTHDLSIGVAKSSAPEGPFTADEEPILSGQVIDPHVFVGHDGTAFLYWKEDNNGVWPTLLTQLMQEHPHFVATLFPRAEDQLTASLILALWPWTQTLKPMERFFIQQLLIEAVTFEFSAFQERLTYLLDRQGDLTTRDELSAVLRVMRTPIYAQRLASDGSRLVGERVKVIENDQAWEAHLVEGIWVTRRADKYYLFYAGNDFSTAQYGIGVAIADSPLGPFRKVAAPFLTSTAEWVGPGHPSVVIGPDGESQMLLHAYFPGKAGYKQFRALLAATIAFESDRVRLR